MQDFISRAAAALGISESMTTQATGALLDMVSKSASSADMQQLLSRIPGAADLLKSLQPPAPEPPPSGMFGALGGLVSDATSALGSLGGSAAILQFLSSSGLNPQQGGQLATMFLDYARQTVGNGLADQIAKAIPGAKSFFG